MNINPRYILIVMSIIHKNLSGFNFHLSFCDIVIPKFCKNHHNRQFCQEDVHYLRMECIEQMNFHNIRKDNSSYHQYHKIPKN